MFLLKTETRNRLVLEYEGGRVSLYYREATTSEKLEYNNRLTRMTETGIRSDRAAADLWAGKLLCSGFDEGDFAVPGENDEPVAIGSDQGGSAYRQDWPDLLEAHAPHFLALLGNHVMNKDRARIVKEADGGKPMGTAGVPSLGGVQ